MSPGPRSYAPVVVGRSTASVAPAKYGLPLPSTATAYARDGPDPPYSVAKPSAPAGVTSAKKASSNENAAATSAVW